MFYPNFNGVYAHAANIIANTNFPKVYLGLSGNAVPPKSNTLTSLFHFVQLLVTVILGICMFSLIHITITIIHYSYYYHYCFLDISWLVTVHVMTI